LPKKDGLLSFFAENACYRNLKRREMPSNGMEPMNRVVQKLDKPEGSAGVAQQTRPHDLRHVSILLIDDDPQAQALIEMALIDAHFERKIEVVTTAAAGLERIKADHHDIYLVDQRLPDGTGLDVIRAAKDLGTDKPFILMTGYGSGALDEAALREGAADYVEKHLVGAHLERSIRYALRNWQASRALQDREEQLRQSQKMEAIGRLAGGVAHDFNNLLTAVIGYTDMIAERANLDPETAREVGEIRLAADRGAALTRQLLAFSRKQLMNPTVLNVNDSVAGLLHMLPRLIGDHIHTDARLAAGLGFVRADASQLEQVIVNLVLNARDAMPTGGYVTIETANVELTEDRLTAEGLVLEPGPYVMLSITDTGVGMDETTRAHAFEPFFTTKAKGKGTGLGLATVYAIIDQSGGAIAMDTAPERGTSIRIYLPVTDAPAAVERQPAARGATEGTETLLLVEDNDAIREISAQALRRRGYTVFEARNGEEAIDWASKSVLLADMLITDVVMPGMSGPNLAARMLQQMPNLRVLYMSGYTDDATEVHGAFWGGVPLLQKPFTPSQLAESVRMALDHNPAQ
jgi:two-component system, cell cycle sensor histidine kinase and response regulator CckA